MDVEPMQDDSFRDLDGSPAAHFRLCFYGAVLRLITQLTSSMGSFEQIFRRFPFLGAYSDEIAARGIAGISVSDAGDRWNCALERWEETTSLALPLRDLRRSARVDRAAFELVLCIGLGMEDARFADVFEAIQSPSGSRRPTYGLLKSWEDRSGSPCQEGSGLRTLIALGVVEVLNPHAPRSEWALEVAAPLWDVMRGDGRPCLAPYLHHVPCRELAEPESTSFPDSLADRIERVACALDSSRAQTIVIRGPQRNGRRTVARRIASALSRGILEINGLDKQDDERWRPVGPLATALHAMPMLVLELSPGESVAPPALAAYEGPLALVLGRHGSVSGAWVERSITVSVDVPDCRERLAHWVGASPPLQIEQPEAIAERYRMTSGNIRRAVAVAGSYAVLDRSACIGASDIQRAIHSLNHEALDSFAEHIPTGGDWRELSVAPQTLVELRNLEARCRYRERLRQSLPPVLGTRMNVGVRALFTGPSGTGKSLAAHLLAASLRQDLYRINLSAVVNKYIGETEKNLNQILSRAEELPVVLLLDEGDALLTQRTHVHTANDRYANLETNFLLQRLESFEGIIIVTTNAASRIDSAFARRMDVVIDFRAPDGAERLTIWRMFLPATHSIEDEVLLDIAARCSMTGAQIRSAVLHASLLALSNGGVVTSDYLESAVRREYQKLGAACPLRPSVSR